MYSNKLVIAVKHNDRVLREHGDTVHIPFGSEYALTIKNKNSVRALVRVEIDGVDVTGGTRLIVPANGSLDLERFIKEGNLNQWNRFKFIERTKKIEDGPRGIGVEDGLVRVEFEFEREPLPYKNVNWDTRIKDQLARHDQNEITGPYWTTCSDQFIGQMSTGGVVGQAYNASNTLISGSAGDQRVATASYSSNTAPVNDVGITVPGSISDQKFTAGAWFPTDGVKHVMIMKLLGEVEGKVVEKPVTVKTKPTCVTCGTVNKGNAKFCRECGTGLTIV